MTREIMYEVEQDDMQDINSMMKHFSKAVSLATGVDMNIQIADACDVFFIDRVHTGTKILGRQIFPLDTRPEFMTEILREALSAAETYAEGIPDIDE